MYQPRGINPGELGRLVLKRAFNTSKPFIDEPVLALYNIGRKLDNDPNWGLCYVSDVVCCNYSCAHCWVINDARNGKLDSDFIRKKTSNFVTSLRGKVVQIADDVFDYLQKKSAGLENKIFAFTGGETLFYRAGIKRIGQRAKQADENITIGVDTNGWLIAEHDNYLDAWEGLQDVMSLYVSIKGVEPKEFQRFTGVDGRFHDYHFLALEKLLKRGFFAVPGGVVLNTLADRKSLREKDNPIPLLHDRLSSIHPELPSTISYHAVSMMAHDPKALSKTMRSRGYVDTTPSLVKQAIDEYFSAQGTPVIEALPRNKGVPGIMAKEKALKRIIGSFR